MITNSRKSTRAGILLPAVGALATCLLTFVLAEIPAWWNDRGLVKKDGAGLAVEASDFAAANQGQLKNVAIAAYEEFLAGIPAELGGIGPVVPPPNPGQPEGPANRASPGWRIRHMISQWVVLNTNGTVQRDINGKRVLAAGANAQKDFAAITQGQLKAVAAPFYARLAELFWSYNSGTPQTSPLDPAWAKPWTAAPDDDNHHAIANLGQLKRVFSLDLHSDADGDGVSTINELLFNQQHAGDPSVWQNPNEQGAPNSPLVHLNVRGFSIP